MRRLLVPAALTLLAGCATDLPPADPAAVAAARGASAPRLVPLDPLLAEGARAPRAAPAGVALQARGTRLAGRAILDPGTGALADRGARLRARADALRAVDI